MSHPAQPVPPASPSGDGRLRHPDIRTKKQLTVKVTEQFAKDLNLVLASYGLTDVSYVLRQSVAAQANGIRKGMAARMAVSQKEDSNGEG